MEDNLKEQNSIFDLDGCIANFNFFINSIKIRLLGILVMFLILFYVYLFIYADIWNKLVEYISSDSTATLIKSCIIILADFLMLPLHSINISKRLNHITGNKKFIFVKFASSLLMFIPVINWVFTFCLWFIKGKTQKIHIKNEEYCSECGTIKLYNDKPCLNCAKLSEE